MPSDVEGRVLSVTCTRRSGAVRIVEETPAVVLLGPRQVGKTTLARLSLDIAAETPDSLYLG